MYYSEYEHLIEMPEEIAEDIEFLSDINVTIEKEVYKRLTSHINDYNRHMKRFGDSQLEIERLKSIINESAREAKIKQEAVKKESFLEGRKALLCGFDKGVEVWVCDSDYEKTDCLRCHGNKKITVKFEGSEMEIPCDACKGHGYSSKRIYNAKSGIIESITCKVSQNYRDQVLDANIVLDGKRHSSTYTQFFPTKEACEEHIKNMRK